MNKVVDPKSMQIPHYRFWICSDGEVSAGASGEIDFRSAPMVKFLLEHLEKSGCGILDGSCWAVHCEKKIAGVYTRHGWIMVCINHMNMQDEVNQVVIHELIHAFDDCRAAPMVNCANCPHHACSEIHAGHLSGDCHYKREFLLCQEDSRIVNKLSSLIKTLCNSKCNFH